MVSFSRLFRKSANILCSLQNCSNTPLKSTGERTKITNSVLVVTPNYGGFLGDTEAFEIRNKTAMDHKKQGILEPSQTVTKTVSENAAQGTERMQDRIRNKSKREKEKKAVLN